MSKLFISNSLCFRVLFGFYTLILVNEFCVCVSTYQAFTSSSTIWLLFIFLFMVVLLFSDAASAMVYQKALQTNKYGEGNICLNNRIKSSFCLFLLELLCA